MFEFLSGEVAQVTASQVVLDVGGVGFGIQADAQTRGAVRTGEKRRLYTELRVSDDRIVVYGFLERQQRELFVRLTAISGVGPKLALSILSSLSTEALTAAVLTEDVKALQAVPGVGRKTAQRLLLELREKVDFADAGELGAAAGALAAAGAEDISAQAMEALEGLGYTHPEALKAVAAVRSLGDTPEELVRFALKRFGTKA